MADDIYPERFCAFIDILGFRDLVVRLEKDSGAVEALRDSLKEVHNPKIAGLADPSRVDYRTQSISDAVAISTTATPEGLLMIFGSLTVLTESLLAEGYFLRGAIVRGRLYHDDSTIFGEALIRAYDLETRVARFPRIMVSSEVIRLLGTSHRLFGACNNSVIMSNDGPLHLHTLRWMTKEMNDSAVGADNEPHKFQKYYDMRQKIERRFLDAIDTPAHFEKAQWFAGYWNRSLAGRADSFRINGPGL
jgi:hypothetical protein